MTPEEHYVAHQLLVKIHPENRKLVFAASMMCNGSNGRNNKRYGWLKKKFAEACRQEKLGKTAWNKGIKMGPNPKISASRKGQKTWNKGIHNPNGAANGRKGAAKLSQTAKGRKRIWISETKWTWSK